MQVQADMSFTVLGFTCHKYFFSQIRVQSQGNYVYIFLMFSTVHV